MTDDGISSTGDPKNELLHIVIAFLCSDTRAASRKVIEEHPELLTEEAKKIIDDFYLKAREQGEDQIEATIDEQRRLLVRCRSVGIPKAFTEDEEIVNLERLMEGILAFAQSGNLENAKLVLESYPELLTDDADELIKELIRESNAKSEEDLAATYRQYQILFQCCRQVGIEEALRGVIFDHKPQKRDEIIQEIKKSVCLEDIPERIDFCLKALHEVNLDEDPILSFLLLIGLGECLQKNVYGDTSENIEDAINAYLKALKIAKLHLDPMYGTHIFNGLGLAYNNRQKGDRARNIEKAINIYNKALKYFTYDEDPIIWSSLKNNLGKAYLDRIKGKRSDNVERSINACNQAMLVRTRQSMAEDWASTMINLGLAYIERIEDKKHKNIEMAIEIYRQVLEVLTIENRPAEWAMAMNNLGNAYFSRISGDRADNIEKAIEAYNQSMKVRRKENMPYEWATCMNNLGLAFKDRIKGDRADNLEKAIECFDQVLQVRTPQNVPTAWATTMNNLASSYLDRINGNKGDNLEEAIKKYEQTLTVRTHEAMPFQWAITISDLANVYLDRKQGDPGDNIDNAIHYYNQALEVLTKEATPIDWSITKSNLGAAYLKCIKGDRAENIEMAIKTLEEALLIRTRVEMPIEWAITVNTLGMAYQERTQGKRLENIDRAADAFHGSLEVLGPEIMPYQCLVAARNLGKLYFEEHLWEEAIDPYRTAIKASEVLYSSALSLRSREAELSEIGDLYQYAAYALTKSGHQEDAVLVLEAGRARSINGALISDRSYVDRLRKEMPEVFASYENAANAVSQMEIEEKALINSHQKRSPRSNDDLRERAMQARYDLKKSVEEIRSRPGYERFLPDPGWEDVEAALEGTENLALIYIIVTSKGSLAVMIHREIDKLDIHQIWVESLDEALLRKTLAEWMESYFDQKNDYPRWFNTIKEKTGVMWNLMGSVVYELKRTTIEKVVLIPTGLLSLLPLHAAWTEENGKPHYALDDMVFTYAPSARSFAFSKRLAERASSKKLFAVDEPLPVNAQRLPNSMKLVTAISKKFESSNVLHHHQATREAVLAAMLQADIVHFSCHGKANLLDPGKSGLLMASEEDVELGEDSLLTVDDLFNLHLKGSRMAILSACETGMVGIKLPEEVIGLPGALLMAGFAGILASLWAVDYRSTEALVERFYQIWINEKTDPARALRSAQQWLRDEFTINEASCQHPFWWAAFYLTGT